VLGRCRAASSAHFPPRSMSLLRFCHCPQADPALKAAEDQSGTQQGCDVPPASPAVPGAAHGDQRADGSSPSSETLCEAACAPLPSRQDREAAMPPRPGLRDGATTSTVTAASRVGTSAVDHHVPGRGPFAAGSGRCGIGAGDGGAGVTSAAGRLNQPLPPTRGRQRARITIYGWSIRVAVQSRRTPSRSGEARSVL
jgi:hypothetical protein